MYKKLLFAFLCLVSVAKAQMIKPEDIVPVPVAVQMFKSLPFVLDKNAIIYYDPFFKQQAIYLQQQIQQQTGLMLAIAVAEKDKRQAIYLNKSSKQLEHNEAYHFLSNSIAIELKATTIRGIVNAMQSLLQLLPFEKIKVVNIPACSIVDYPKFDYRGMHLDVVRHFFSVDYIKKYIEYLSFHKFNTFHWHLTDDQGWRIEMLNYKKLNEIGSWRNETLIGHFRDSPIVYDGKRYGGFYSRKEVKDIVDFAAIRGITVIPEIDIPGHSRAILAAYPELGTRPDTVFNVATTWGMYNRQNNVLAPKPATFQFLKTVFQEIADLFPSKYFHLGGDECSKIWWKRDAVTQKFMQENKLKDEKALQSYFIEQVAGYLKQKNKIAIGWHEILESKIDTNTIVMNWGDDKPAIEAAAKKHKIIMTPGKPLYFDHYQSETNRDSLSIHGFNSWEAVYRFNVIPDALIKKGQQNKVMGAQANVWTEYMAYPTKVDYMIFPRMTALSEVLWSYPEKRDTEAFKQKLGKTILPRYKYWNSSYYVW